jgi:hypothetical protein
MPKATEWLAESTARVKEHAAAAAKNVARAAVQAARSSGKQGSGITKTFKGKTPAELLQERRKATQARRADKRMENPAREAKRDNVSKWAPKYVQQFKLTAENNRANRAELSQALRHTEARLARQSGKPRGFKPQLGKIAEDGLQADPDIGAKRPITTGTRNRKPVRGVKPKIKPAHRFDLGPSLAVGAPIAALAAAAALLGTQLNGKKKKKADS